jgi:cysteine-rich repeat protein
MVDSKNDAKRMLASINLSQSVITGISSPIEAFTIQTITLITKDLAGNDIGVGGEIFRVEIKNKWTIPRGINWVTDSTTKKPLQSDISGPMTDHGNGTYTYDFSLEQSGEISILIMSMNSNGVNGDYYTNSNLASGYVKTNISSNINFIWGNDGLPGRPDNWAARFKTYVKPLYSGTYTITVNHDDGSNFIWNGASRVNRYGEYGGFSDSFSVTLTEGIFYFFEIRYVQILFGKSLGVRWSGPSTSYQVIPNSRYFYPQYFGSIPYHVTVTCSIGYSGTDSISPYRWKEIWGDGIRVGAELWDDGNTANNDGCNSNWGIVESNFICVGGTVTSSDTCTPWQTGYHPNGSPTSYKCVETWGDGLRYGEEICDDGNAANGNGCSSDCKTVESNYICVGGTTTSSDTWSECTTGRKPNSKPTPDDWIPICGDGRNIDELWDDGNLENGDGCGDNWIPEYAYGCLGGDFNNPNIWFRCYPGYISSKDKLYECNLFLKSLFKLSFYISKIDYKSCVTKPMSRTAKAMRVLAAISVLMGLSLTAITAVLTSSSSSSSSFGMMNQLQMIIILSFDRLEHPRKSDGLHQSNGRQPFYIWVSPTGESSVVIFVEENYDFPQMSPYLYLLGLESGSSIVSVTNILIVLSTIVYVHASMCAVYLILKYALRLNWIPKQLRKVLSCLTFGTYITALIETYLLIMFVVMNEISENDDGSSLKRESLKIAYVILTFMILFKIFVIYQWIKSFSPNEFIKLKYFKTLFEGLKNSKWSRAFPVLFLLRRGIFSWLLFIFSEWYFVYKVSAFFVIELIYFVIIDALRPFESMVDNFLEIMNEVFYLIFIIIIWTNKRLGDWNSSSTSALFSLLLTNNGLIMLITNSKNYLITFSCPSNRYNTSIEEKVTNEIENL